MKLIKKKTEVWNGVEHIKLSSCFPSMTENSWNEYVNKAYMRLLTYPEDEKSGNCYKEFVEFYNHIIKELKIKTI